MNGSMLQAFDSLQVLLGSISASASALFWSSCLLFLIQMMVALFLSSVDGVCSLDPVTPRRTKAHNSRWGTIGHIIMPKGLPNHAQIMFVFFSNYVINLIILILLTSVEQVSYMAHLPICNDLTDDETSEHYDPSKFKWGSGHRDEKNCVGSTE